MDNRLERLVDGELSADEYRRLLVSLDDEPSARDTLSAGADLVCFSGDKLLGGPQAGIVAGRADLVERLHRHPLQRALRADKLTLAALEGTLALYLDAPEQIPVLRMIEEPAEVVHARAERLAGLTGGSASIFVTPRFEREYRWTGTQYTLVRERITPWAIGPSGVQIMPSLPPFSLSCDS